MAEKRYIINASIVTYHTPVEELQKVVSTLLKSGCVKRILLIDNSENRNEQYGTIEGAEWIWNGRNIGYGAAHNIAIRETLRSGAEYHLVINSDIEFNPMILSELAEYMEAHKDIAQIMPKVLSPDGSNQHLAKLLPTPYDLIARRFLPKTLTRGRTRHFELHHLSDNGIYDIPYLSGCFMLLRADALKKVGIFDERYFMYPEDIDLTRRLHKYFRTIYYPQTSIIHNHRRASYHNIRLLKIHIVNMIKYFNKWGWIIDRERQRVNKSVMEEIEKSKKI